MVVNRLKEFNIKDTQEFSYQMRKKILEMSYNAGSASIWRCLICTDIISVIFSKFLKYKKENLLWHGRDRFILSKGHACLAYYQL